MPLSPNPIGRFARTSQSHATRRRPGEGPAPLQIGERGKQVSATRHAINARRQIAMQSATYAEISADRPALFLDALASAKSSLAAHP